MAITGKANVLIYVSPKDAWTEIPDWNYAHIGTMHHFNKSKGAHKIHITRPGYHSISQTFIVKDGDNPYKQFIMEKDGSPIPKYGGIEIKVFPETARVEVPDLGIDRTGSFSMGNLKTGAFMLRFYPSGKAFQVWNLIIKPGEITKKTFGKEGEPEPEPSTGALQFEVSPEGARIRIPGLGIDKSGSFSMGNLKVGEYKATVTAAGYQTRSHSFPIRKNMTMQESVTLKKLDEPEPEPQNDWEAFLEQITNLATNPVKWFTSTITWLSDPKTWELSTSDWLQLKDKAKGSGFQIALALTGTAPLKIGASAAAKIAQKELAELGAEGIIATGAKAPAELLTLIQKVPKEGMTQLFRELPKTMLGRDAIQTITRLQLDAAEKAGLKGLLKAGKYPLLILGAAIGIVGFKEFMSWGAKELPELLKFPLDDLIRNKEWERAKEVLPMYENLIGITTTFLRNTGFEALLGFPLWQGYADGYDVDLAIKKSRIEEGLQEEPAEEMGTITFHTDPIDALISVPGYEKIYKNNDVVKFLPGNLTAVATLDGYYPKTKSFYPKAGVEEIVSLALTKIADEPEPGEGILQVLVYDQKTDTAIGATLLIDGNAEEYSVHSHVVELDPGSYEIVVEKVGYKKYEDTISIDAGKRTSITVKLEKTPHDPEPEPEPEPEPKPKPEPAKGIINIATNPSAEVWSAGAKLATETPTTLELVQGIYSLKFTADGFKDKYYTAYLSAGEIINVSLNLTPVEEEEELPWLARVSINSDPIAAKILVNGSFIEKYTPDSILLEPGVYTIGIQKSRYKPWQETINLERE